MVEHEIILEKVSTKKAIKELEKQNREKRSKAYIDRLMTPMKF